MTVVSESACSRCQPKVPEQGSGESKSKSDNESGEVKVGRLEGLEG